MPMCSLNNWPPGPQVRNAINVCFARVIMDAGDEWETAKLSI